MINIDKISFEFAAQDRSFVYGLYRDWDGFCREVIEPIIDEVLSGLDDDVAGLCVESIELNIGKVSETYFFEEFPVRFREELVRAARLVCRPGAEVMKRKGDDDVHREDKDAQMERRLSRVFHYLDNRTWGEQSSGGDYPLQDELKRILSYDKGRIERLVKEAWASRTMLERMLLHLDGETLENVLNAWLESRIASEEEKRKAVSLFAKEYPYLFLLLLEKIHKGGLGIGNLIELVEWENLDYPHVMLSVRQSEILQYAMGQLPDGICPKWSCRFGDAGTENRKDAEAKEPKRSKIRVKEDMEAGVYRWLLDEGVSVAEKRECVKEILRGTPPEVIELVHVMREVEQTGLFVEILNGDLILELIDCLCKHQEAMRETGCWMYVCDWLLVNIDSYTNEKLLNLTSLSMDKNRGFDQNEYGNELEKEMLKQDLFVSGPIAIGNAGLVLLTPWFPRLFAMLGLLGDDGKDFKDVESRKRAVFMIQRMVTLEDRVYTASDLVFNRILVNLPSGERLPDKMELTDEEMETIDEMLEGVKSNWPCMANTSVKGFKHSFVERQGVLEMQEERMSLTVEPRTYDLLLDSLPWGYKLVRFPWLEKRIHVSWRDNE